LGATRQDRRRKKRKVPSGKKELGTTAAGRKISGNAGERNGKERVKKIPSGKERPPVVTTEQDITSPKKGGEKPREISQ